MNKTRVLVLEIFIRLWIFNLLWFVTWLFDGTPNINAIFLMFFLILIVPLPRLEPLLFILDEVYIVTSLYLRVLYKLLDWGYRLVVLPSKKLLTPVVFLFSRPYPFFLILIRATLPFWRRLVIWLFPVLLYEILSSIGQALIVIPIFWMRSIYWFIRGPLRWLHSLYFYLNHVYQEYHENSSILLKYLVLVLFTIVALVIALPSPVSVLNYLVTGYGYPGSIIRFSHCPAAKQTNLLSYLFLEISYSLWGIIRTAHFYLISKYLFHGSWEIYTTRENVPRVSYNTPGVMKHFQMICVGTITPLVLPFQCSGQVINNVLCSVCNLGFLTILNGHTRANFFLFYYGACSIFIHIESAAVAVASTMHSLRLSVNDHVTTGICIMQLYLMLHVSWTSCKIIWKKLKCPADDILGKI